MGTVGENGHPMRGVGELVGCFSSNQLDIWYDMLEFQGITGNPLSFLFFFSMAQLFFHCFFLFFFRGWGGILLRHVELFKVWLHQKMLQT